MDSSDHAADGRDGGQEGLVALETLRRAHSPWASHVGPMAWGRHSVWGPVTDRLGGRLSAELTYKPETVTSLGDAGLGDMEEQLAGHVPGFVGVPGIWH